MSNNNDCIWLSRWLHVLVCFVVSLSTPLGAQSQVDEIRDPSSWLNARTHTAAACDLLGLGAIETVPFNFPGATLSEMSAARLSWPGMREPELPAGTNDRAPLIFGTDLGAPFVHAGQSYYTFGDALFVPTAKSTMCSDCASLANDLLASAGSERWSGERECLALQFSDSAEMTAFEPITWNGPASVGGAALGPGRVPGPGFSTGPFMFMFMARPGAACSVATNDCAAVTGIPTDLCIPSAPDSDIGNCYFGECGSDPASPCVRRAGRGVLAVRAQGNDFVDAEVGVHVHSQGVVDAYRGHFAVIAFYADVDDEGHGKVWVIGRDSFWGTPGLTMAPFLMYHPVAHGMLEEPLYFVGMNADEPSFSGNSLDAQPLYREDLLSPQHTSLAYWPEVDGGTWVMLYGGHAQPILRAAIAEYVKPVIDGLFFDHNAGVLMRFSKQPWGPWSAPRRVFDPYEPTQGGFCEGMYFEDPDGKTDFECPEALAVHNAGLNRSLGMGRAGEYGVAFIPNRVHLTADALSFQWLMSTWNPYRVVVQQTVFRAETRSTSESVSMH